MADIKKYTVDDQIEVLMTGIENQANVVEYKEFAEKVEEIYKHNVHKAYEKFNISLVKDKALGWGLIFSGTREETKDETAARETLEASRKKQIEDAELKEYLRLKKKFGKKEEQQ
jgi:hypothetical protein